MKIRILTLLSILLIVTSCSGVQATTQAPLTSELRASQPPASQPPASEPPAAEIPATAGSTEPAAAQENAPAENPVEEEVIIPAAEGLEIHGTFRTGNADQPRPGVLLLHMVSGKRADWLPFADVLVAGGYAVLAIDLRGHGDTRGGVDWDLASRDIPLVLDSLAARPEVDPERVAIAGASIGANLALVTAAEDPEVDAILLLSPGLDYYGIQTEEAMEIYGSRPALIVVGESDAYAASSSQKLAEIAANAELQVYPGPMHGTQLFYTEDPPEPATLMLDWLDEHLAAQP